jgi:hypothetical protein
MGNRSELSPRPPRGAPFWRVPASLRAAPIWFLTEPASIPAGRGYFDVKRRHSPVTLYELRPNDPDDFSDFTTAYEVLDDHRHWFDSLGIRISPPWFVVILRYCFQPSMTISKDIGESMKQIGGYWERTVLGDDAQGILWAPKPIDTKVKYFQGSGKCLLTAGLLNMTGIHIPGRTNDPLMADQAKLTEFISKNFKSALL